MEMRAQREAEGKAKPKAPQEPAPTLFPDLFWIWAAFCYLSDRRGVSANGPVPITIEAMEAFARMSNRYRHPYIDQLMRFVPVLDREYLRDFYDKQKKEMEKMRKKSEQEARRSGRHRSSGIPSGRTGIGKR